MHKYEYNDYEILYLIRRKSDLAYDIIYHKYKLLALKKIKNYNLDLMTKEDIVQECMLELHKSINKYNELLGILFITYVDTIFHRKITRLISGLYKDVKVKEYIFINNEKRISENKVIYNKNIEEMVVEDNLSSLYKVTTDLEKKVLFEVMFNNMTLTDFCSRYNVQKKKLYNIIQRIRKKCNSIIDRKEIDN